MPFDLMDGKGVINNVEQKRLKCQRYKNSSFETLDADFGNVHSFYLNRERVSKYLDIEANEITPIQNDW